MLLLFPEKNLVKLGVSEDHWMHRERISAQVKSDSLERFSTEELTMATGNYDNWCFEGGIAQALQSRQCRLVAFCASREDGPAGILLLQSPLVTLEISPAVVKRVYFSSQEWFLSEAGPPCENPLDALLFFVEHALVHLAIVLNLSRGHSFDRAANATFGHRGRCCVLGAKSCVLSLCYSPQKTCTSLSLFRLDRNSCYLDSLLMVILAMQNSAWREAIVASHPNTEDYSAFVRMLGGSHSQASIRTAAKHFQNLTAEGFNDIHSASLTCLNCDAFREVLWPFLPEMKSEGRWVPFSTSSVYDCLAELFPKLQAECLVQTVRYGSEESPRKKRRNLLQMFDFVDSFEDTEKCSYEKILWNELSSPLLVFQNGGLPPIKDFTSLHPEEIETTKGKSLVRKQRIFSEILLDRYQLCGVVTLQSNAHYVAFFKSHTGWFFFDDQGPSLVQLTALPNEGVFKEERGLHPELLFYALNEGQQ